MRDLLVTVVFAVLIPFILNNARIGVYAWAWIAMMVPHRFAFGFARTLPFAQAVAIATLVAFLFSRERKPFPVGSVSLVQAAFVIWMSFTTLFAINPTDEPVNQWIVVLKIHLMLFVTMMLLRGRKQIEILIAIVTLSVGFYGIKGGLWTVATGGGGRVWGPSGGVIAGNNELGLALVMLVPFFYYLFVVVPKKWMRLALGGSMFLIFFGILGTHSRGALLAVLAMAFFLGFKSRRPWLNVLLIGLVLSVAIFFMPENWTERMMSIGTFEQDTSAMSRIYTWLTLWNLALDRPFVGGGFAADNPLVFAQYAPMDGAGVYLGGGVYVAHSIYFQALGEHGFPGLFLYLLLGVLTWWRAGRVARWARYDPEFRDWVPLLMRMVQVSLVGFAVGGAFLSLVHFDLPYYIVSYVVLVEATMREKIKRVQAERNRSGDQLDPSRAAAVSPDAAPLGRRS